VLGRLHLNYEVLLLADDVDEQRLVTWLSADDAPPPRWPAPSASRPRPALRNSASSLTELPPDQLIR